MKTNFLLAASLFAAVLLSGCSGSDKTSPDTQTEEVIQEEINNNAEPPAQESQDIYYDTALAEARNYVKEKENESLTPEKLEAHADVVRDQANQLMDEERKAQLQQLASRIEENDLAGVKQLMEAMEEN